MKIEIHNLPHLSQAEKSALSAFREKLFSELPGNFKELILFGSKARGDDAPDSDFDLLVVVFHLDREVRNKIYDLAADAEEENRFALRLSPIVWEEAHLKQLLAHERRIALDIQSEGIRL